MPQNTARTTLSRRQAAAIEALLTHGTQTAAAQAAGIDRGTLARWLTDPEFCAQLRAAEAAAMEETSRRVLAMSNAAVTVVASVMADRGNPPAVRLRAADSLLDRLSAWHDRDLERRIVALEERLGAT